MSLNYLQIIKTVLDDKIKAEEKFFIKKDKVYYLKSYSGMSCTNFWCYKIEEEVIKLSELRPQTHISSIHMKDYHKEIELEILKNGFDYSKGMIQITSRNLICDGHHRYKILLKNFGENHEIRVRRIVNINRLLIHFIFIIFIVRPILLICKIFKFFTKIFT